MSRQDANLEKNHGGLSLCETCRYSHVVRGQRISEELVYCGFDTYSPMIRMPFCVRECTNYRDRRTLSLARMEDIAWVVDTRKTVRRAGFLNGHPSSAQDAPGDES